MARDYELQQARDQLAATNAYNDELCQQIDVLENKLKIAEAELRAAKIENDAHRVLDRVPLPTETHPFMPEPVGKVVPASVYRLGIPAAFEFAFGIPKGAMLGRFLKGPVADAVSKHYPKMRRSAARAVLIDNVCGKAVVEIPLWAKQRTKLVLDMLDTFETMIVEKHQDEARGGSK